MEGFLPLEWCIFWFVVSLPFVVWGVIKVRSLFRENPDKKLMVAVSGAFIFVVSSLKLPSVTGSSSHPTGTAIGTVLYGVGVTSVLTVIVLLFQAVLLAHGGLTTLGANVFSMGIAGPLVAYALYRGMRRLHIRMGVCVFAAAVISDLVTYVVTAMQLALAFPTNGHFLPSFEVFFIVYGVTQVPLAIMEGVLTALFFSYLAKSRPDLLGVGKEVRPSKISKRALAALTVVSAVVVVLAMVMVRVNGLVGSDNAGSDAIIQINPQYVPWASSLLQLNESTEIALFAFQAFIGLAIIAYAFRHWRRKRAIQKTPGENSMNRPPVLDWPPLGKLLLVLALLLASLVSRTLLVPLIILGIGLALLAYTSQVRLPRAMFIALVDGIVIVGIGAIIIALVTAGAPVWTLQIGPLGLTFTDTGIETATRVFLRAVAGITVMLFYAASTPIPHLAQALRQLRVPKEIAELVILIYRYSFLVLEEAERMMLAAQCRLGMRGYRNSMRTISKVAMGMFIRSIGIAERSQITLRCRNFRGDFPTYREPAKMNLTWAAIPVLAFAVLFTLNLLLTAP